MSVKSFPISSAGMPDMNRSYSTAIAATAASSSSFPSTTKPSSKKASRCAGVRCAARTAATAQPQPAPGVLARRSLRITLNGMSRQAHRLTARGGAGWEDKTQLLFVTPDGDFDRAQLVEKLRALALVLGFELAVAPEARPGPERGEQEGGA